MTTLSAGFSTFPTFIMNSIAALRKQVNILAVQYDYIEMRCRGKMLLSHGVTEEPNEDSPKVAVNIVRQHLLLHNQLENLSEVHRLGTTSFQPRPIIIKFKSHRDRDKAWAAKVGLKGSGITSEFLTKRRHKLFLECRSRLDAHHTINLNNFRICVSVLSLVYVIMIILLTIEPNFSGYLSLVEETITPIFHPVAPSHAALPQVAVRLSLYKFYPRFAVFL
ncbi:unnamed protein product [Diatraea saccharalis]|uniref:Uncharacterized protein n=1 Tax=Diatraea saccharalis TaxID=40085 RepID=A0A9N9WAU5_9NEOP|nr:unnamed protein product [Diatraea saccharalis]